MSAIDDDVLVQTVKDRLEAQLPALLETAELPEVKQYLDYDPPLISAVNAPAVWVDASSAERSADSSRGATLHKYSVRSGLMVGVVIAGEDPGEASTRLRNLVRWVRKVVEGDQTVDGNALWILWQATDYSPSYKHGTNLLKVAILSFEANHRVTLGQE